MGELRPCAIETAKKVLIAVLAEQALRDVRQSNN